MGFMLDKLIAQAAGENPEFWEELRAKSAAAGDTPDVIRMKKGGKVKKKAKGGMIKSSASRRADGCAVKGKTKGRMV